MPVLFSPPRIFAGEKAKVETTTGFTVSVAEPVPPFAEAVRLATVVVPTGTVVAVNVAVVAPPATVTVAGTVTDPESLARATTKPPVGAALPIVSVPVELEPPNSAVGDITKPVTFGAVSVTDPDTESAFAVPVMLTVRFAATATVVAVNVADVAPLAIVTEAGTVNDGLLLESETTKPPVGAAESRVIVPVELTPPTTVVGDITRVFTLGAVTARVAVCVAPFPTPVIVAVVSAATATVVAVNVALDAPAGMVKLDGTVTADELLLRETTVPPAGAGPLIVAVPVDDAPPATVAGFITRAVNFGAVMVSVSLIVTPFN